jgi:hypothetical protein
MSITLIAPEMAELRFWQTYCKGVTTVGGLQMEGGLRLYYVAFGPGDVGDIDTVIEKYRGDSTSPGPISCYISTSRQAGAYKDFTQLSELQNVSVSPNFGEESTTLQTLLATLATIDDTDVDQLGLFCCVYTDQYRANFSVVGRSRVTDNQSSSPLVTRLGVRTTPDGKTTRSTIDTSQLYEVNVLLYTQSMAPPMAPLMALDTGALEFLLENHNTPAFIRESFAGEIDTIRGYIDVLKTEFDEEYELSSRLKRLALVIANGPSDLEGGMILNKKTQEEITLLEKTMETIGDKMVKQAEENRTLTAKLASEIKNNAGFVHTANANVQLFNQSKSRTSNMMSLFDSYRTTMTLHKRWGIDVVSPIGQLFKPEL